MSTLQQPRPFYDPETTTLLHPENGLAVPRSFVEARSPAKPACRMRRAWMMTDGMQHGRTGNQCPFGRTQGPVGHLGLSYELVKAWRSCFTDCESTHIALLLASDTSL
jgi:hypothetical protein